MFFLCSHLGIEGGVTKSHEQGHDEDGDHVGVHEGGLVSVPQGGEVGQVQEGEGEGGQVASEASQDDQASASFVDNLLEADEQEAASHGAQGHEDTGQSHEALSVLAQGPGEAHGGREDPRPEGDLKARIKEGQAQL